MSIPLTVELLPRENDLSADSRQEASPVSRRRWLQTGAAILGALTGVGYTSSASAATRVVALGEVESKVRRDERWLQRELKKALKAELGRMEVPKGAREQYVLSVNLTQLFTKQREGRDPKHGEAESTAVISAVLRKRKGGTLHAILRGKATAVDSHVDAREIELSALQGAVHSALRRVPDAITD
ncbi:MAG: hypothetical protein R3B07_33175 [Polyangiaceae bacterium]